MISAGLPGAAPGELPADPGTGSITAVMLNREYLYPHYRSYSK